MSGEGTGLRYDRLGLCLGLLAAGMTVTEYSVNNGLSSSLRGTVAIVYERILLMLGWLSFDNGGPGQLTVAVSKR